MGDSTRPSQAGSWRVVAYRSLPLHHRSPIQIHNTHIRRSRTPFPTMTPLSPQAFFLSLPPCSKKMALEPPTYSPSAAVPTYSESPGPSERTLAVSARSWRRTPTGTWIRSNKLITIAIRGQEENALQPSFSRGSTVWGDIALGCTLGVQSISIKVRIASRSYTGLMTIFYLGGRPTGPGRPAWRKRKYYACQQDISCLESR